MTVIQFTYNASGKYAVVPDDSIQGIAYIYNQESEMLDHINRTTNYKVIKIGGNYALTGRAGLNYLTSITQSGNAITAISWSTSSGAAVTTNNINTAVSIAQAINNNF